MDIGKPMRVITVEPVTSPVPPEREPAPAPKKAPPEPEKVPAGVAPITFDTDEDGGLVVIDGQARLAALRKLGPID